MISLEFFILICLTILTPLNGCGVLPSQQGRTINFNVTGFKLPAAMVYSEDKSAPSQVANISTSQQQAVTFVRNIVMRSIEDVLDQQGRGAGLSYDVISLVLNQIDVTVKYEPLKCDIIFTNQDGAMIGETRGSVMTLRRLPPIGKSFAVKPMMTNCQIISGTVTKTCNNPVPINAPPPPPPPPPPPHMCTPMLLEDIKPLHSSISGSITTTNIIMANWSTQMWQNVLNRALRIIASGQLGSYFIGASVILQ